MKRFFLAFAAMLMAFSVSAAEPNIYASGLKAGEVKDGKVEISYLLNATATALEVQLIGADNAVAKAFPLTGDDLAKGAHKVTVDLADVAAGTYTWAVKASAAANEAFAEVFKDSGSYVRLQTIIDNNPESPFFGQIYGQNKAPATYLHAWNADYTSLKSGFTADITWGNSSGRPAVDANGKVWLAEYSDDHSGVFVLDPATWKVTNFFEGTQNVGGGLLQKDGVDVGGSTPGVAIYGTGADMKLYVANEDAGTTTGTLLYKNGYNVYNIGAQENPYLWTTAPSLGVNAAHGNGDRSIVATKHGVWLSINRTSDYGPTYPSLDFYDHAGTRVWYSNSTDDQIKSSNGGGIAILSDENGDEKQLAIIGDASTIQIYDLTWTDNKPILTLSASYSVGYSHLRTIHFDYAGNLVTSAGLSNDGNTLVVFALPKADNSCVTPAPKANTITVAAAAAADTYVVAGSEALCGSSWNTTDENNLMTEANGVYIKVYTNVPVGKNYQLKVVKNGNNWFGDATGNNITFHIIEACDVTVTFNPATSEITVTGTGVTFPTGLEIEAIYAVGNGGAEWLNGANWDQAAAANKMAEVSPFVYQIAYTGVPAGNYELKFAANGAWTDSWGEVGDYTISSSIEDYDAAYNGGNIKINNTFAKADIALEIDLSKFDYATKTGAKFSVTITEQAAAEPVLVVDTLSVVDFPVSGTSYASNSGVTAESKELGVTYASQSASGNGKYIQLRSNNNNSGVVTTASNALAKEITIKWNSEMAAGRVLSIYGSNTAYAAPTDLYGDAKGTLIKDCAYADGAVQTIEITDSYQYIGVRSKSGALYIDTILVAWEALPPVEATAVKLDKETAEVEAYKSLQLTATLEPEGATTAIEWSSSDEAVATVSATGLVTALAPGTATIKATAGTVEASCALTVKEATVLTAAEAAAIGIAVSGNNVLAENGKYVVEAYVIGNPTTYDYDATIITVNLADERGAEAYTLQAYKATGDLTVADGDKVRIVGDLSKYNTTPQLAAGAVITLLEKALVPLSFEFNGGTPALPTNEALFVKFKADLATYFGVTYDPEMNQIYTGGTGSGELKQEFLTSTTEKNGIQAWKWLGDYIIAVVDQYSLPEGSTYQKGLTQDYQWRAHVEAFFLKETANTASSWNGHADFSEAGKPEAWASKCPLKGLVDNFTQHPTKEGYKFLGWFDNAACEGEALTECPAGGTLYAGWEELVSEIWFTEGTHISALESGESIQFHVEYEPEGATLGAITWSIDEAGAALATISETGLLTAKAGLTQEALAENNQVVVTATVDELKAESYVYIVPAGPKKVTITAPESTTLGLGETLQLEATTDIEGEFYFNWETSDDQLATVTTGGLVEVVSAAGGKVWVYVTVDGYEGLKDSIELTLAAGYPNISAEPTSDNIVLGNGSATIGEEAVFTFLLKGENLAKDVVLTYYPTMATFQDNVLITPDTLSAAALQGDGVALTITITPGGLAGNRTYPFVYTYVNEDAELEFEFASFTVQVAAVPYENLAAIIADLNAGELYEWDLASVASDLVVTHVSEAGIIELGGASVKQAYIQDATAGVVLTQYGGVDVVRGEHYATLEDCYFSIQEMDYLAEIAEAPLGESTKTEEAVADVITLADIAKHQGRLVRLNGVTFAASEAPFAADGEYAITIGEGAAKVVLFAGSELIGEAVPTAAVDLVGIVRSTVEGNIVISPRDKADIIATTPSALDNVTINGEVTKVLRNGQVIIIRDNTEYNVLGTKLQ